MDRHAPDQRQPQNQLNDVRHTPNGRPDDLIERATQMRQTDARNTLAEGRTEDLEALKKGLNKLPRCFGERNNDKIANILITQHMPCERAAAELDNRALPQDVRRRTANMRAFIQKQVKGLTESYNKPTKPIGLDGSDQQNRPFSHFLKWNHGNTTFVFNPNAQGNERSVMRYDEFVDLYEDQMPPGWRD